MSLEYPIHLVCRVEYRLYVYRQPEVVVKVKEYNVYSQYKRINKQKLISWT